jgi:hypothetical protein
MIQKISIYVASILLICLYGCKHDPCEGVISYHKLDERIQHYIFKPGTYWVYNNAVDGINDSQYVYSYNYSTHLREPYDTVASATLPHGASYCGPFYYDILQMDIVSYYNGAYNDTLSVFVADGLQQGLMKAIEINEFKGQANQLTVGGFYLDPTQQQYGTAGIGLTNYLRNYSSLIIGSYTFHDVDVFQVNSSNPNTVRFRDTMDLYFVKDYGIVRMTDHRLTGKINWDLLRYHIAQ